MKFMLGCVMVILLAIEWVLVITLGQVNDKLEAILKALN